MRLDVLLGGVGHFRELGLFVLVESNVEEFGVAWIVSEDG